MNRLYVRAKQFPDRDLLYWNQTEHAWGCISSATVFDQAEVDSFKLRPDLPNDHAVYMCRNRKMEWYVPGDGEWIGLPDIVKLKTIDEWLADIDIG